VFVATEIVFSQNVRSWNPHQQDVDLKYLERFNFGAVMYK
jgi:hypothetical protein